MRIPTLVLLAVLAPAPVVAQQVAPPLRVDDQARMDGFDAALGRALRQVLSLPPQEPNRLAVMNALSGAVEEISPADLVGDWKCQTIKMGKTTPATAYENFDCRISADGPMARLEKLGGSQRMTGTIGVAEGKMIFAGVGYIAGDTPPAYADLPEVPPGFPQRWPVVGQIEAIGDRRVRLMMPSPWLESDFDLLYLVR